MIQQNPSQNLAARPRPGCLPVLLLLAAWLALVTPLRADNPPTYLFQIETPSGFLPNFLARDSSNNLYVSSYINGYPSGIEKFSSSGTYLTQFGTGASGPDQHSFPAGIAVDSSNHIYVADGYNNSIENFTTSLTYLGQWGGTGSGNGQFREPIGIALDSSNNVYVVDSENYRVEKFSSSGKYLTQWGGIGTNNGQFQVPLGVAVDSSGNFIYVADLFNSRVQVFVNNTNIVPPIITNQPGSQTFLASFPGLKVTFSVGVVGAAPFAYQWSLNNVAVAGATNATFILTNAGVSDSGDYSVLVTNSYGSELSSAAVLAIVPAFVTTQPASGISANGAVLNGSATVGPDETVVWFDWGTDTAYGNIAGTTNVPGNNGSNNISAPLTGLPGNIYHYRLDAANDSGIVYGEDQWFTVGFAPTATTLGSVNNSNGSTFNAVVNPEGWDTTVYFQWRTPTLTNTTPGIDIGAGATSLNVSSFVTGLDPSTPCYGKCQVRRELYFIDAF